MAMLNNQIIYISILRWVYKLAYSWRHPPVLHLQIEFYWLVQEGVCNQFGIVYMAHFVQ